MTKKEKIQSTVNRFNYKFGTFQFNSSTSEDSNPYFWESSDILKFIQEELSEWLHEQHKGTGKQEPTIIKDLPGKEVDAHLKIHGHLPEENCCESKRVIKHDLKL